MAEHIKVEMTLAKAERLVVKLKKHYQVLQSLPLVMRKRKMLLAGVASIIDIIQQFKIKEA